jgi:hypothetical protein
MGGLMQRLHDGFDAIIGYGPAIVAFLVIILFGLIFARQLERWVDGMLSKVVPGRGAAPGGPERRTRPRIDPMQAVAKLAFWLVMLMVVLLASAALGLESIGEMFRIMLGYIPAITAGIVIVIVGVIVGEFIRSLIAASSGGTEGAGVIAKLAKAGIILIAVFMAVSQLGVAADIVSDAFILILGGISLAFGLAFGLGNRDLAGEITRRWYEEGRRRREETPPPDHPAR